MFEDREDRSFLGLRERIRMMKELDDKCRTE